jgi:hypothetical protein
LANYRLAFISLLWLNNRRLFLVVLVISAFWTRSLTLLLLILIPGDFLAFLPPFLMFGGQNGVITFSVSLQKSNVSNWILTMWRRLMRYFFYMASLHIAWLHPDWLYPSFPFQLETTEPPNVNRSV